MAEIAHADAPQQSCARIFRAMNADLENGAGE